MRQCIIFILYLLCTFTARSQSVLTPEQAGSIYYAYPAPPSVHINPEKPDVPLNKNDAFQKVQKRRVQEKR